MQFKNLVATFLFSVLLSASFAQKVNISTTPQNASIFVNGKNVGTGEAQFKVPKNECITIAVQKEGYLSMSQDYCNKKGFPKIPKNDYIKLAVDDSYEASTKSDIANNQIVFKPKKGKVEENWKTAIRVVTDYLDAIEVSDSDVKYLRTSWKVDSFKGFTVRTRVILRYVNESPQEMKIKLVSEIADGAAVSAKQDEKYKAWDRILKKYGNLLDEVRTRTNAY